MPEMLASRLVALQKRKGGIRPISVGKVWLRFVPYMQSCFVTMPVVHLHPNSWVLVWLGEHSALVTPCVLVPSLTLTMSRLQQT